MNGIWTETCKRLSQVLTPTAMETWFSECDIYDIDESRVILTAPDDFRCSVISSRFSAPVKNALHDLLCADFDLHVLTTEEAEKEMNGSFTDSSPIFEENEMFFDNFLVGESNILAFKAAMAIAAGDHKTYNSLFIYGNSGLGKTHLLSAVMHDFRKANPSGLIVYCRSDEFTNRMIRALQTRTMDEFRKEFRKADLLLIDDVEFIAGKQATQEEFYNTFNEIYHSGGSIVLTSDRPPRDLPLLEDRLKTRFEGGILAEVTAPDRKLRKDYICSRLRENSISLETSEVEYIADCCNGNFRQLSGVLKSIRAYYEILGTISHSHLEKTISGIVKTESRQLTPEKIIQETAHYFDIDKSQICGLSRERKSSAARQAAMYLCRDLLSMTLNDIGISFSNRDHATVAAAIRKARESELKDSRYAATLSDLRMNLKRI